MAMSGAQCRNMDHIHLLAVLKTRLLTCTIGAAALKDSEAEARERAIFSVARSTNL